ncbi:hypothetical protein D1B31_14765 [Neobacillus notoginsengisoli]|uniref:Peptidase M28 domain-containing protein n=1 Tax=Neobacillus notoginsengisoli TaxID=1578198 RepID=A0A417YRX4_9BACI|nr:M28 family metallopeptidase [Neobacillus notoginsengisoli]RHW38041.1 hypothetical protein D1B31_14765 [Neobacillus notoginsengisoli]
MKGDQLSLREREIMARINAESLMEYNRNIAREVRLSGSEEELRAFHYAKQVLESLGMETELSFHDAYISLPNGASLKAGKADIPCITHSMAPTTVGLVGEPIYIGRFNEEKAVVCKGKIALIEGIANPSIITRLEAVGAAGAIFINGVYTHEMIVSTVWGSPTKENMDLMPRIPVVSINDNSGKKLLEMMAGRLAEVEITTKVETAWKTIPTLIAEIKGNEEPEHFILFSGHIDSWHYGAMDNGSANASMLEIARVLSDFQADLSRTVRFAFWSGHSHGRYAGSQAYCDENWEDIHENCVMHFYIDSVGGKGATILSESNCMAETKEIAALYVKEVAGQNYIGSRYGKYADQSFWGAGVPSLFMGMSEQPLSDDPRSQKVFDVFAGKEAGGFGWWWHTVEDTIDKIDPANLKRDCEIYAMSIYKVATEPILPINQLEAVREIKNIILKFQTLAENKINLNGTVDRLIKLEILLNTFDLNLYRESPPELRKQINRTIMNLSRCLVPINYVGTDVFEHDPAIALKPIPSLADLYKIASVEEGTHEFHLLKTAITRKLNKVNYLLKLATKEAEKIADVPVVIQ